MNKPKIKYCSVFMVLFCYSSVFSQFNTVTPMQTKKTESPKILQETKEKTEENPTRKKDKKSWKEILNITTKSDLKNQIDSLKMMIKENSVSNKNQSEIQKLQDSVIALLKKSLINNYQKNNLIQYDEKVPFGDLGDSKIVMPLNRKISVTSPFGVRTHPIFGSHKMHNGIDLKADYENVYSVLDGIVSEAGWDSKGGGNYIKVNHFNRFETAYLHLSEIYYRVGERVKAGFIIAKSGNTGNSTGPHLHFSVKEFGQNINPTHFLNDLIKANNLIATYYAK